MKLFGVALTLFSLPLIASAQSLQVFFINVGSFINTRAIPFLLAVAFLFFVYNAIRFFVVGGNNKDGQEKAKALALYGVATFVLIITFWGIVNILNSSIGIDKDPAPKSDYIER